MLEEVANMIELKMANHLINTFQYFLLRFQMYAKQKSQKKNTAVIFAEIQESANTINELITNHKGATNADDSEI